MLQDVLQIKLTAEKFSFGKETKLKKDNWREVRPVKVWQKFNVS